MATLAVEPVATGWESYASGSAIEHFRWWCETYCVQSIDQFAGQPLTLEPFQLDFMGEALSVDADDLPLWKSCVLVLPRKNGKSSLLAAYAIYMLMHDEGSPEILLAASSDKQAGRLFDYVKSFVRQSAFLRDQLHIRDYIGEIARKDGEGKLLRMSSSPERLHGYNPSLVICDELAQWLAPGLRRAWAALTTGGGARKASQTFTITTAGEAQTRKESILGRLIDRNEADGELANPHHGLTISRNFAGQTLVHNFSAATTDPNNLEAIKQANPASWITTDYLARQAANPELTREEFLQLHGCVWVEAAESWIKHAAWDALECIGLEIHDGAEVYVGIDAAFSQDCTAVGLSWRLDTDDEPPIYGVTSHVWSPKRENPAHEYSAGGLLDNRVIVPFLQELAKRVRIVEVVYDRRYFDTIAIMLDEVGFRIADAWSNADFRAQAWKSLEDGITGRTIAHNGDPVLATHVTNAQAEHLDSGIKVSKLRGNRSRKIDALVAVAMAHWRAARSDGGWSKWNDRDFVPGEGVDPSDGVGDDLESAKLAYAARAYQDEDD